MAQDFFIATLAILTVVCGSALLAMLWRRRQRRGEAARRPDAGAQREPSRGSGPRPIDDYALPVSFEAQGAGEEERDVGKICPACGSRYGSHFRYCERDNAELAALN